MKPMKATIAAMTAMPIRLKMKNFLMMDSGKN
jgi:hypothetical protein